MSRLVVYGGRRLNGEIDIHGAKNSVLPILAATLLIPGVSVLHNCPNLSDVAVAIKILTYLGCKCEWTGDTVTVDASTVSCDRIPDDLMREMRSSVMFLGAILARCNSAVISSPGGCELGPRPIDLHLKALKDLGYTVKEDNGYVFCSTEKNIKKERINLSFPSVGATENAIMAACLLEGRTVITGAAREPEICDLADFLNKAGAKIRGAGTDSIEIIGVKGLYECEHRVIPDRIVAATYMSAAAITGGSVRLNRVDSEHLNSVINSFGDMGCEITCEDGSLCIKAPEKLKPIRSTKTFVYPGFPTDAGPLLVSALCCAGGCSVFVETIFENRFKYMNELARLGANIRIQNSVAVIEGVNELKGASVNCTDLRGGAALVVAGLAATGITRIEKVFHIERGYEDIARDLNNLGAKIIKECD